MEPTDEKVEPAAKAEATEEQTTTTEETTAEEGEKA